MAELIDKGALIKKFNDAGVHIEFDLPVEEILGEDVDIDDFAMLVQDAIQAYRKMVIGTIQNQPTVTEAEIRASAIDEFAEKLCDAFSEKYGEVIVNGIKFEVLTLDGATEITWDVAEQLKGGNEE